MLENRENAIGTLFIGPPDALEDNNTIDHISEDKGTPKDNVSVVSEKIPNNAELSHLVETGSNFWEVIPIDKPGLSSEKWHTIMVQNHLKYELFTS